MGGEEGGREGKRVRERRRVRKGGREGKREEEEGGRVERVCKQCVSVTVKIYVHCDIHVCRLQLFITCTSVYIKLPILFRYTSIFSIRSS